VPSKRIININSVSRDKKGHYLIKAGSYSFLLNENAFTDGFYYEGKELNDDDLALLKEKSSVTLLSDYAYSLLSRRNYSRHEIKEKLHALEDGSYGMILRAKGMVPAEDGTWIYFDYVPGESDIRSGAAQVTGKLCVIGSKIDEDKLADLFLK